MTMIDQLNQAKTTDRAGAVFTFTDQNGSPVLFDSATGQSCAFAYTCPMTDTDSCDGADATQCPSC